MVSETVPAKLQTYMSSGKAILGMISGDANKIILESNCGLVSEAGDYEDLANNAIKFSEMSVEELKKIEDTSLKYYNEHYSRELLFAKFEKIISEIRY